MGMGTEIGIVGPAAPVAGATVTLADSTVNFGGLGLRALGITHLRLDFAGLDQPSASGGLIGYKSPDKGTNWYKSAYVTSDSSTTLPATVAAQTSSDGSAYIIDLAGAPDAKFTWTASGTAPTVWPPTITWVRGKVATVL